MKEKELVGNTRRLYYEDAYCHQFEAEVVAVSDNEVALDQTAFFPEGGGQAADEGVLTVAGIEKAVLYVHEKDGHVWHRLSDTSDIAVGNRVCGEVNFGLRFSRMQAHSGEHIVSGLVHRHYGLDNVGFHLGKEVTLDFDGEITKEGLCQIEREANEVIWKNVPITATFPSPEALSALEYRSKLELTGDVRIVTVEGVDCCACCAPHVSHTGEIGQIRLIGPEKHKDGIRVTILAGRMAYDQNRVALDEIEHLIPVFSAKESEVEGAVRKLKTDYDALWEERKKLMTTVLASKADIAPCHETLFYYLNLKPDDMRYFANLVKEKNEGITAVFSTDGPYVLVSDTEDVRPIQQKLAECFGAKGGGSRKMVSGRLTADEDALKAFFLDISKGMGV